jgi:Uma2 family endonuclease
VADPAKRRATYEDYLALPAHVVGEIINGVLQVSPRPAPRHAYASSRLGGKLDGFDSGGSGGPGGWWILFEPEIQLTPREPVSPDLAGWRRERMPALPSTSYFDLPPDWVCEVLSPSTAAWDRSEKLPLYAEHGVPHAWLIDPILRTLEVFALDVARRYTLVTVARDDAKLRAPPFEALELDLAGLWATPAAPVG